MGLVSTVVEAFATSTQSANRGEGAGETSAGAYWCHDCGERVRDVEGETPSSCPDCGDEMEFERSAASTGCAC